MEITSLNWLIGDRIVSGKYNPESRSWLITFKSGATLNIECIWRLLEEGGICSTCEDHMQQFGRAKKFDGEVCLTEMGNHEILSVDVKDDIGDISIVLGKYFILQIVVTSAGYEAWQATHSNGEKIVAISGQLQVC